MINVCFIDLIYLVTPIKYYHMNLQFKTCINVIYKDKDKDIQKNHTIRDNESLCYFTRISDRVLLDKWFAIYVA